MDHKEAVRLHAADRYLLGELSDADRERFEEHYFCCLECAEDVKAGDLLRANAAAVLREKDAEPGSDPVSGWRAIFGARPALAFSWSLAGLLLAVAVYQNLVVLPGLRERLSQATAPQTFERYALRSLSRGEDLVAEAARDTRFIDLALYVDPDNKFQSYRGEILDASGSRLLSVNSPAPRQAGLALEFLIPAERLTPGAYRMIVHGFEEGVPSGSGTAVGTYPFVVKLK